MSNTLYIIGNGFDVHHGLHTKYIYFAQFLKKKNIKIYEYLIHYFDLSDINPNYPKKEIDDNTFLWSNFESALADFDVKQFLDDTSFSTPNYSSDDFRDRDRYDFKLEMEEIVDDLTANLCNAFKDFILNIFFPNKIEIIDKILPLDKSAQYLNFNYTDTLERYYDIDREKIKYIHNKATDKNAALVLGHGVNTKNSSKVESIQTQKECHEQLSDYSYVIGKDELLSYFNKSFKNTSDIIETNSLFFSNIKDVEKIIILGHSLSSIDTEYFKIIIDNVQKKNITWFASYYSPDTINSYKLKLLNLGLKDYQISLFRIDELKK